MINVLHALWVVPKARKFRPKDPWRIWGRYECVWMVNREQCRSRVHDVGRIPYQPSDPNDSVYYCGISLTTVARYSSALCCECGLSSTNAKTAWCEHSSCFALFHMDKAKTRRSTYDYSRYLCSLAIDHIKGRFYSVLVVAA